MARRVVIMGAAGRDFHNFNVVYRDDPAYQVVSFTATQIPGIAGRRYPSQLAGPLYPEGIPIVPESDMDQLLKREGIDEVVFAYSDVSHETVMHAASRALAAGADFVLLGPGRTMLTAHRPVVAICAVRTGSGKSQTTRRVAEIMALAGLRVAVVRHPMPYGDLVAQRVQRFDAPADLDAAKASIEEREEYEPHIAAGRVVFAGVDYAAILSAAEAEADVILWDGGNNDLPFYRPDLLIVVADPLRAGDELHYHPGEAALRMADLVVINKIDSASAGQIAQVRADIAWLNPRAAVLEASSAVRVDAPIDGARVVVVEDGPTLTHGGMTFGAGIVAAQRFGAVPVDPRPYAVGSIAEVLGRYPDLGPLVPAMGYGEEQTRELAATLDAVPADLVLAATPIDLTRVLSLNKPVVRVRYDLHETDPEAFAAVLEPVVKLGRAAQLVSGPRSVA
jgi:predicted GTPase